MWKIFTSLLFLSISTSSLLAAESKTEQTLSMIKPDGVANHHIGDVISHFEKNGLRIAALKMIQLTKERAGDFYIEHKGRPFYTALTEFMSSGPVVVMVLEGKDAIAKNRKLMGATDPKEAAKGTIRKKFAKSKSQNTVHGSDSPESAKREIAFFFTPEEISSK